MPITTRDVCCKLSILLYFIKARSHKISCMRELGFDPVFPVQGKKSIIFFHPSYPKNVNIPRTSLFRPKRPPNL
ncbi:MAG: hypothetical protein QME06_03005, partial [Desulfobacterales bacterium]|nr:hypothetical protein [Desulfobacterales bacterium]